MLQVTSINSRFAKVHILYVGSTPLKDLFRGTIRWGRVDAADVAVLVLSDALLCVQERRRSRHRER